MVVTIKKAVVTMVTREAAMVTRNVMYWRCGGGCCDHKEGGCDYGHKKGCYGHILHSVVFIEKSEVRDVRIILI